jgi:hypothetical protein
MFARCRQFAGLKEKIAQIHVCHGLPGMLADGFGVGAARGSAISGEVEQRA